MKDRNYLTRLEMAEWRTLSKSADIKQGQNRMNLREGRGGEGLMALGRNCPHFHLFTVGS